MPHSNVKLKTMADELGTVKAAIAELKKQEKDLRDVLVRSNCSVVEGDIFRVSIRESTTRKINARMIIEGCEGIPKRLIDRATKVYFSTVVKVSARKVDP